MILGFSLSELTLITSFMVAAGHAGKRARRLGWPLMRRGGLFKMKAQRYKPLSYYIYYMMIFPFDAAA